MAERAEVPVVVAYLRCDPPTLMRGDAWYAIPARAAELRIEQLPTIRVRAGQAREAATGLQALYSSRTSPAEPGPRSRQASSAPLAST